MKRKFLVLALGISFLILMAWIGTFLSSIVPRQATAQVQQAQAGPYLLTLQVDPNPPPITRPATLALQIQQQDTQQVIKNAHVQFESNMEAMDMGTALVQAQEQKNGLYLAQVHFSMSGEWQIRVRIDVAGKKTEQAVFTITAQ
jgi:hypothetical protein